MNFDTILIVANPQSRRDGMKKALWLQKQLNKAGVSQPELLITEYARHAPEFVYEACRAVPRPLVIAVSGDGGNHEVVNGLMRAKLEAGNQPTLAVFPAGNANDFFHAEQGWSAKQFAPLILAGQTRPLDIIQVGVDQPGLGRITTYEPAYVGFGLTGYAAQLLMQGHYGRVSEYTRFPLHALKGHERMTLKVAGEKVQLDSLTLHNIARMAKRLKFPSARCDDGQLEMLRLKATNPGIVLRALAGTRGFRSMRSMRQLSFELLMPTWCQFGGEPWLDAELKPVPLPAGTGVHIECLPHALQLLTSGVNQKAPTLVGAASFLGFTAGAEDVHVGLNDFLDVVFDRLH